MAFTAVSQRLVINRWWPIVLMVAFVTAGSMETSAINLYGLAGNSHINKPVTSMREGKFKNLVEQRYDFSCGAAAVATILRYGYGQNVTELDVLEGMMTISDEQKVKDKGFSLLDIRNYVETLGLRGRGYEITASALYELRIPTIALVNIRGYQHFVIIRRVAGETVYVGDPALGNITMPMSEFLGSWNGTVFAVVGQGFDRDTVLSRPEPPLTAHNFIYDRAPISDSELLDFGFRHAELF